MEDPMPVPVPAPQQEMSKTLLHCIQSMGDVFNLQVTVG